LQAGTTPRLIPQLTTHTPPKNTPKVVPTTPAPTPIHTPTAPTIYGDLQKTLWIYISSRSGPMGATSWRNANDRLKADWRPILQQAIGTQNTTVDLSRYTRIIPHATDNRLILEAPNAVDRRALLHALRSSHSPWKCQLHLSANCKANRSLLYHKASFHQAKVADNGDILVVSSLQDTSHTIRIELYRTAAEVD
jgi:hypothetical protein